MIWTILIIIAVFIAIRFATEVFKDKDDLQSVTLDKKFETIVNTINDFAFNGNGKVTVLDKRSFNLYEEGTNQIISFFYSTGHLQIIWKYKYFQEETVVDELYSDVRNINIFKQQNIAKDMIEKISLAVPQLKNKVLRDINFNK
jgi:hypothetical protein